MVGQGIHKVEIKAATRTTFGECFRADGNSCFLFSSGNAASSSQHQLDLPIQERVAADHDSAAFSS